MFMQETQSAVGKGKSKKKKNTNKALFVLQQPRFYPLVAERCLALQISAPGPGRTQGGCPGPALAVRGPPLFLFFSFFSIPPPYK